MWRQNLRGFCSPSPPPPWRFWLFSMVFKIKTDNRVLIKNTAKNITTYFHAWKKYGEESPSDDRSMIFHAWIHVPVPNQTEIILVFSNNIASKDLVRVLPTSMQFLVCFLFGFGFFFFPPLKKFFRVVSGSIIFFKTFETSSI